MANTRVNIDVNINTSAAAKNLRQLQAQINSFQSALNTNNRLQGDAAKFYSQQLKDLANQSGFFSAETVRMRTAASQLDQTLSKGQGTMRQFISARFLKDSAQAAQVLSLANARASALQTQFVATGAAANGFRDSIAIRPLQAFNSATMVATQKLAIHRAMLMQATTSMINFGKNTQWAGRQLMVGFTVPLTIFGGMAGKVFKEIEEELVNFKKVYGDAFTPPEELEANIEAVKGLASEFTKYGIAVKDTIGLAAKAAATGAQGVDLIAATTESTRLATLGQMDQNQALETTIALQTAFNISSADLAKTIDFLNMVENQTVVTLQDLAAAIPRVAPVIKGLGGSVEDMAVMLAAMREGGVTAAQGANALKSGLASLINPSDRAVETLGKMGINLNAIVQANRGDLMGTVKAFAQALSALDDFSQQQALEKVFGKFQYARLGALFKNIVKDGSQASRVMDTAAMSAQELAASSSKELGAIEEATGVKFTAAMEKFKLAIAPIGEMFLKVAIPILNFFTQLAEKFNNLPDFSKKFAALAAIIVGIVIPAGTMFLGLLMNLAGTLIKFGSIVGIAFKGFTTGGLRGAIDAVSQALNYMSLADIDAANASQQLGTSTEFVNKALRDQVPAAAGADAAIDNLSRSYAVLIAQMAEAAALSKVAFVAPGAAMAGAAAAGTGRSSGPRVRRNKGGTIPGSGNTDTVPAMLTPGEFVINKQATAENLPLLYAINKGSKIPGFNKGGQIPGMQYFAARNPQRIVQELSRNWNDDAVNLSGMFATGARGSSRASGSVDEIQRAISLAFADSSNGMLTSQQVARLLNKPEKTVQNAATALGIGKMRVSNREVMGWRKLDVDGYVASLTQRAEKAHFGTRQATQADIAAAMRLRGTGQRAQFAERLFNAGIPVSALTDDWATFSSSLNQAANRGNTKISIKQAIEDILQNKEILELGPAISNSGVTKDEFLTGLVAQLRSKNNNEVFTDKILTEARDEALKKLGKTVSPNTTGLRIPAKADLQEMVAPLARKTNPEDVTFDEINRLFLNQRGFELLSPQETGLGYSTIRDRRTGQFEKLAASTGYNLGGLVTAANSAKGIRTAVPKNITDWFTKMVKTVSESQRDELISQVPNNISMGFSKAKKKINITRGSVDPLSGRELKEVSSWTTGKGVGRYMESSSAFDKMNNAKFQISWANQSLKKDVDWLKTLGPDGPTNPYSPFNQKDGALNFRLTDDDIAAQGGSIWKANKAKLEQRIQRNQEFISGHKRTIDELRESFIPTVYSTSIKKGQSYLDVSGKIVPKDSQRLNTPGASTDILDEKEVALLGSKLTGRPKTRIVEKAEAQSRYDKARKEIREIRRSIYNKEVKESDVSDRLKTLIEETENMASFVNWGRGREISYPGIVSKYNVGGKVVPALTKLQKIQKADPRMAFTKEQSLEDILKMGFNDTKTSSPSSFLSTMFARWEKTPSRPSLKENTRIAKKTGKLKYPMTPQDEYLADMIMSMSRFDDYAPDLFKPITIGNNTVYDGHTRIQAKLVKGIIEKDGKTISSMSKDDLLQTIDSIKRNSLAGKIDDSSILSVAQQQSVLTQQASRRDMEGMSPRTHPKDRRHMPSMFNMEGRTLVPGVHDKEITELVSAGRAAKFRGYGDTDDEILRAMGFVRLGKMDDSGYFYNPTHDYGSRKGYVANTSSRIIRKLVEEGKILPIQRNMGGIIPQMRNLGGQIFESARKNIVPGVGNTDTVPAVLTPGEFVINKDATQKNLGILNAINSGKPIGLNLGGKVPGIQNFEVGGGVDDWGAPIVNEPDSSQTSLKDKARAVRRDLSGGLDKFDDTETGKKINKSKIGQWASRKLSAGERAAYVSIKALEMLNQFERNGIYDETLDKFTKLSRKQQYKERNLLKAEQAVERYDKKVASWESSGRPLPRTSVDTPEPQRTATTTSDSPGKQSAYKTDPSIVGMRDVYGYDSNGKAVTDGYKARLMANSNSLYDSNGKLIESSGKPIAYEIDKKTGMGRLPEKTSIAEKVKFALTRKQKIWAAIAGTMIAGTATGIGLNEKNKTNKDPLAAFNLGGTIPGAGNRDTVPAMLTPGEFVINKKATAENLSLLQAINNGQALGFNAGGKVPSLQYFNNGTNNPVGIETTTIPAGQGMERVGTSKGKPIPVEVTDVTGKAKKGIDARSVGKGAAAMGVGMGVGVLGYMGGAALGEKVGGENGAMVGGIAGSMAGLLLPRTIGKIPTGGLLPAIGGKKAPVEDASQILKNSTVGKPAQNLGKSMTDSAKNLGKFSLRFGKFARLIPLLLNPWTALAAAVVATTYTLYQMHKSNEQEYEVGRAYADAMTTSTEDLKELGQSARERARNTKEFLRQSESQNIQEEYAQKIAAAKTKGEKKSLEIERDKAVQARGTMTRGEAFEKFYDKQISEAKKQGASQDKMRRLYEQRNQALSVSEPEKLDFGFDKTFGADFLKGAGQKDYKQFQMTKDFSKQVDIGQRSSAELETMRRLSDAAYGITSSVENVAELDMASKLAQYVLSGAMSQDQASSIAEAVGAELGDLKIGQNIRTELAGLVGANGQFAKNRPGEVASELMERNKRRTQEMQKITKQNMGWLLAQTEENQTPGRTKKGQAFDTGNVAGFNLFTGFFAGMADEARRNVGSLIELQTSEYQMLEENIAAVGLAYNDLIAKSKTLEEAERYRFERSSEITKLQERRDELQEERSNMVFGSEQNRIRLTKIGRERLEAVREAELETAGARQNVREIDPITATNFLPNLGERIGALWNLGISNISNSFSRMAATLAGNTEEAMPSSFAQIMTSQMKEAAFKKYEGTSTGAALTGLSELIPVSDPIYAIMWQRILDDENYAMLVPAALANLEVLLKEGVDSGNIGEDVGRAIAYQVTDLLTLSELPSDIQARLAGVFGGLDIVQTEGLLAAFGQVGDIENQYKAYERFLPLMESLGELSVMKLPSLGGKGIMESILGDPKILSDLAQNDESLNLLMDFFKTMSGMDLELQTRFIEQFDGVPAMIKFMEDAEKIKFSTIVKGFKDAKTAINNLSSTDIAPEKLEDFDAYLMNLINRLNDIEDPEIKARLTAEIGPEVLTMINLLQMLKTETDPSARQDILDQLEDFAKSAQAGIDAATPDPTTKKKPTGGSGGTKEDPLADIMRDLLATADLLSNIGTNLLSVDRKSKSIFDKLRDQDVNESVIGYLRSMGPEQAIEVGKELLGNQKKLNTIMQLAGEAAIASQQDAARVAQERAKFVKDLVKFKSLSGSPLMGLEEALGDDQFISDMSAARGTATPNKSMRAVQQNYFARQQAQREALSAMAPTIVSSQVQKNTGQTYVSNQLASKGLSEEEISMAMQNEAIMAKIQGRLSKQLPIGPKIVDMVKNLYASTRTTLDVLDEGLSKVDNVFNFLGQSLENATQQIDRFTIKPLQDELDKFQEENSELSEKQRRFSKSLSELQEDENDLREKQKDQEEEINNYYDSRIDALEKVDKINKNIAQGQQDQLDVASALSRGDIGAAAKAAASMEARSAQAKRDLLLENLREQKEKDIDRLKTSNEEELKNLTISVNGELLTREQIQQKINEIDQTLYDNSLKEYDLQKSITAELRERKKIEDQIEKISIARTAVSALSQINQSSSQEDKRFAIQGAKQSLQLLGGAEAQTLINLIDKNFENLMSSDQVTFGAAMVEISGGLSPIISSLGTGISGLNIQIPNIQTALDTAVTTANTELPNIFNGIKTQIENLNESIDIDPESKNNPFAKVYKAAKKVAALIAAEFVAIKPKSKGGGGGGGDSKKPPTDPGPGDIDPNPLGTSYTVKNPTETVKQTREKLLSKSKTQVVGGQAIRITQYYNAAGYAVPHLTKYEVIKSSRVSEKYDSPLVITGYDEIDAPKGASKARTKRPLPGLPFTYKSPSEEQKLSMQDKMAGANQKNFQKTGLTATDITLLLQQVMLDTGQDPYSAVGKDIAQGIVDGIVRGTIAIDPTNIGTSLEDAVKAAVGAKSPATKMFPVGGMIAQGIFKGILDKIIQTPQNILTNLISGFKSLFGITDDVTGSEDTKVKGTGTSVATGFFQGIIDKILKTPRTILTNLISGVTSLFGIGEEGSSNDKGILGIGTSVIGGIFSGLVSGAAKGPIGLLGALISSVAGVFGIKLGKEGPAQGGVLAQGDGATNEGILGIGMSIMKGIFQGFIDLLNDPKKTISNIVDTVKTKLENAFESAKTQFGKIGENIWGYIGSGLMGLVPDVAKDTVKRVLGFNKGGEIKRAFGGSINYRGSTESAPGMMFGGKMKKFATGSFVPGIGNTDTVPALLTPGEFVVRKSVAQAYGPLLQAINSDVFPKMNMTSLMPSASGNTSSSEVVYNYQVNVNVTGSNSNADEIANAVLGKIKSMDARNIRGTRVG